MAMYLVKLYGDERTGDDHSKPLSPTFHQPKTDPLGKEQAGINEAANSNNFYSIWSKVGHPLERSIDIMVTGSEAKHLHPMFQHTGHVFMKQVERATPTAIRRTALSNLNTAI